MIVDLDELRRIELHADDFLVLRLSHLPEEDELERLAGELERVVPDHRVIVLGPGAELEVVRPVAPVAPDGRMGGVAP